MKRWFGVDADGTEQYILLKTPNSLASADLIGSCSPLNAVDATPCHRRNRGSVARVSVGKRVAWRL